MSTDVFLVARDGETPSEAWADSEGLYVCASHQHEMQLDTGRRLVPVPADLATEVLAHGQCEVCWDNWADGLRRYYDAEAAARWEVAR